MPAALYRPMANGWTFQRLIDEKMKVPACCHHAPCNHHHVLDLAKLRDRFGPDAPAIEWDIRPKLRCGKCGGKAVSVGLIYSPDTSPNGYGKARMCEPNHATGEGDQGRRRRPHHNEGRHSQAPMEPSE